MGEVEVPGANSFIVQVVRSKQMVVLHFFAGSDPKTSSTIGSVALRPQQLRAFIEQLKRIEQDHPGLRLDTLEPRDFGEFDPRGDFPTQ